MEYIQSGVDVDKDVEEEQREEEDHVTGSKRGEKTRKRDLRSSGARGRRGEQGQDSTLVRSLGN